MDPRVHFSNTTRTSRRQRYYDKLKSAEYLPISLGCVNFMHDGNLAFLIRTAACFGVKDIHVIGNVPDRSELRSLSGSTVDFINIVKHSTPRSFIDYMSERKTKIVAAELNERSTNLFDYRFDFSGNTCIFTGHETTGVPVELLVHADCVQIEMPGPGFCLNTAQTANIITYEALKQYRCVS